VGDVKREGSLVLAGNGGFLSVGTHQAERCWLGKTKGKLKHAPQGAACLPLSCSARPFRSVRLR
jgi:hypothetical protein